MKRDGPVRDDATYASIVVDCGTAAVGCVGFVFYLMVRRPPSSKLVPYTPLYRASARNVLTVQLLPANYSIAQPAGIGPLSPFNV